MRGRADIWDERVRAECGELSAAPHPTGLRPATFSREGTVALRRLLVGIAEAGDLARLGAGFATCGRVSAGALGWCRAQSGPGQAGARTTQRRILKAMAASKTWAWALVRPM